MLVKHLSLDTAGALVDTHAHLNDPDYDRDLDDVVERAQLAGVKLIVCVGYDLKSSRCAVALAEKYSCIFAVVGVHPHDASSATPRLWEGIEILASGRKVLALGEMGFDFYRNLSPRRDQEGAFRRQLQLAVEMNLPVVIHDRDAHMETLAVLKEYPFLPGVVVHCFSGDIQIMDECLARGYYLGIGGPLTYPKNETLREVVRSAPLDRILLETDCPYLAPQRWRGKRNEPSYLTAVAEMVAQIKDMPVEDVAAATTANAVRFFRINER